MGKRQERTTLRLLAVNKVCRTHLNTFEATMFDSAADAAMNTERAISCQIRAVLCSKRRKTTKYAGYSWCFQTIADRPGEIWAGMQDPKFCRVRVSNWGRIKQQKTDTILKGTNSDGYMRVGIGRKYYSVHQLVCLAYHAPLGQGPA